MIQIILIGLGLSMDAFAVSICKGLEMKELKKEKMILIALFFGLFQALMPLIGWFLGSRFAKYITSIDHWISFVLLIFIGGKMLVEGIKNKEELANEKELTIKELFLLSIATSIDALAVGITLAFVNTNIWFAILIIGLITFILSMIGVLLGHKFGAKYQNISEIIGGIILILIGIKILLEHLGYLSFL